MSNVDDRVVQQHGHSLTPPPTFSAIDESAFQKEIEAQVNDFVKSETCARYKEQLDIIEQELRKSESDIQECMKKLPGTSKAQRLLARLLAAHDDLREKKKQYLDLLSIETSNDDIQETNRDFLIRTGQLNPLEGVRSLVSPLPHKRRWALMDEPDRILQTGEQELLSSEYETDLNHGSPLELSSSAFVDDRLNSNYQARVQLAESLIQHDSNAQAVEQIDRTFSVPSSVWAKLFDYQKVGIRWLLDLHLNEVGGILADEMGLGKTVQIISFLVALKSSQAWEGCSLVVCPATVLQQWMKECHNWWPPFRIGVFHSSFCTMESPSRELLQLYNQVDIIITSYSLLQLYSKCFLGKKWFYVVLDEGHKIRNPNAQITAIAKQLKSFHRICVTGTPIQNNLVELWSIFDFVYPGKLGSLSVFQTEFALPINMGGYANAGPLQVQTSYKCAVTLRDMISPYMLRRWKKDVAVDLPRKEEQVCLCKLTKMQREMYENYLESSHMQSILEGRANALHGIDILRKICNHPLLLRHSAEWISWTDDTFADNSPVTSSKMSGKLLVLGELLKSWKLEGERVLVFCQTRQMLDIVEQFIKDLCYSYLRMDGTTEVGRRQALVQRFNNAKKNNDDIFCFLLTTRVGGLGINLTGASRVVIYDPDWNPSTDLQARERAWRYGQTKDVLIYRLVSFGTIEEKIYHRQIFKQVLTNRILQNPKHSRFFKATDLYDLFSLEHEDEVISITDRSFVGSRLTHNKKSLPNTNKSDSQSVTSDPKTPFDNLLGSLLEASGIHSAHSHEEILNACAAPDAEYLSKEADKIVGRSLRLLQDSNPYQQQFSNLSKRSSFSSNIFQPSSLDSNKPIDFGINEPKESFSVSRSIISNLTGRTTSDPISLSNTTSLISPEDGLHPLAHELVAFLKESGGSATSDTLLTRFQAKISPDEAILFKKLLKAVASLSSQTRRKEKMWILKSAFS